MEEGKNGLKEQRSNERQIRMLLSMKKYKEVVKEIDNLCKEYQPYLANL